MGHGILFFKILHNPHSFPRTQAVVDFVDPMAFSQCFSLFMVVFNFSTDFTHSHLYCFLPPFASYHWPSFGDVIHDCVVRMPLLSLCSLYCECL